MSCVRRDYELSLCGAQTTPAGSKTKAPLAKVDPTSNADGTFPICLRKGKKPCVVAVQENERTCKKQPSRNLDR